MSFNPSETQIHKRIARVRSRHMIPMEMLAFITLLLAGVTGAVGPGWLHDKLARADLGAEWGIALIPIATAGVIFSAFEWWGGQDWQNGLLRYSVAARMWASGLAFVMWLYALHAMAALPDGPVTSVVLSAIAVSPFHLWSWWVNYRVYCVLHPTMRTEKLAHALETNRNRW